MVRTGALVALVGLAASVAALETEVLFEGADVSEWDTARDRARLEREFSASELAPLPGEEAFSWRFVSKGVAFNDIFLRKPIRRPFERLRFRLMNRGESLTVASKVRDANGAEWTAPPVRLPSGSEWSWVEFPWDAWKPASWSHDADGQLDFPLTYVVLIAFDVAAGKQYDVRVRRVEVMSPEPPVAELHAFRLPREAKAGSSVQGSLRFRLDRPCKQASTELVLVSDGVDRLRFALSLPKPLPQVAAGEDVLVDPIELRVPQFAHGGEYAAVVRLGEARVVHNGRNVDEGVCTVSIKARRPGRVSSAVREHGGVPTLFINDQPVNGMAYTAYGPSVSVFSDFEKAGVSLFSFSATPTEAGYGLSRTTWTGPGRYDYSQLDERVLMVLEADPEAYIFPRLYLHAPKWWSKEHPDDVVMMDPGDGKPVPFIHSQGLPAPSWASEAWRQDTIEGLRRLIQHVEASPYADRVIGYHLASGTTEEWMMWGANEGQWVGYSPANVRAFRAWLTRKYRSDEALQAAWSEPAVSLGSAAVPTKAERAKTGLGSLRRPQEEQAVIDFYRYNSEMVADTMDTLAKAVKTMTRGEKTVGVFYGYLLQLCGEQRQQNAGHLALTEALASPHIDFLCSPTSYRFRQLGGEGTSHFMSLLGSVKQHGKVWFNENDIRTSLSPGEVGGWGKPADIAGDILQQDKELANALVNGAAQWWFDVGRNRYDDPTLMKRIGELTSCATECLALDRTANEEVALVVDERSLGYLKVGDPLGRELLIEQLPALHRTGAPAGHYLVSDLPRLTDHKLFLITTSFAPTAADRAAIEALKGGGRVLVFCYASGLYLDGAIRPEAMQAMTGIRLRLVEDPTRLRVTLGEGDPLTKGLDGQAYGPDRAVSPVCIADDPEATVLGTLADGSPGLVLKRYPTWTAVHSAAPLLPVSLLRRLTDMAGVHHYVDTSDVVWACESLVAVSVKEAGERTIRLRRRAAAVSDLYTGERVAADSDRFRASFGPRATRVFVVR